MKIADAIIVPTLIIVASKRPSSRFRSVVLLAGGADELMGLKAKRWNDGTLERWKGSTVQHSIIPSFHHSIIPSFPHSIIPSFHPSQRSVGVQVQPPSSGRADGTRQVEADEPIEEARSHTDAGEWPSERELVARGRPDRKSTRLNSS